MRTEVSYHGSDPAGPGRARYTFRVSLPSHGPVLVHVPGTWAEKAAVGPVGGDGGILRARAIAAAKERVAGRLRRNPSKSDPRYVLAMKVWRSKHPDYRSEKRDASHPSVMIFEPGRGTTLVPLLSLSEERLRELAAAAEGWKDGRRVARSNPRKRNPVSRKVSWEEADARLWQRLHALHARMVAEGRPDLAADLQDRLLRHEYSYAFATRALREAERDYKRKLKWQRDLDAEYGVQRGPGGARYVGHSARRNPAGPDRAHAAKIARWLGTKAARGGSSTHSRRHSLYTHPTASTLRERWGVGPTAARNIVEAYVYGEKRGRALTDYILRALEYGD